MGLKLLVLALAASLVSGCGPSESQPSPPAQTADTRARALADAYLEGYFDRNPDEVTAYGIAGRRHDRLPDNSFQALQPWRAKEDAWLAEARQIDPSAIQSPPLRATYAITKEALEG